MIYAVSSREPAITIDWTFNRTSAVDDLYPDGEPALNVRLLTLGQKASLIFRAAEYKGLHLDGDHDGGFALLFLCVTRYGFGFPATTTATRLLWCAMQISK